MSKFQSFLFNAVFEQLTANWGFTRREAETFGLLIRNSTKTSKIALVLGVTESTANKHVEAICRKTGFSGRFELLQFWNQAIDLVAADHEQCAKLNRRVYIAEDDQEIAQNVADFLQGSGFEPLLLLPDSGTPEVWQFEPCERDIIIFDLTFESSPVEPEFRRPIAGNDPIKIATTGNLSFVHDFRYKYSWDRLIMKPFHKQDVLECIQASVVARRLSQLVI